LAGPILLDQVADDLNLALKLAGPLAAGTGRDGCGQYDQRLACQNPHHETADGWLCGGQSEGGLHWGGSEIRVPAPLLQSAAWTVGAPWLHHHEQVPHRDVGRREVWMPDDLDDRNRVSSTASSRRGERHRDGDSLQIHQSADLDALRLIQTVPGAVRTWAGVPQIEPADGRCDRPSSMPDGLHRTVAGPNVASQNAVDRIAVDRVAMNRKGRDRFQHVPTWGGRLRLPDAASALAGHFQIVSSAEIRVAVRTQADRGITEQLAGG
jgi:hypothetical protein